MALLSFSRELPWGESTHFEEKICGAFPDPKIHTFRTGYRFKPGMKIHFWMGSPRTKHHNTWAHPFNPPFTHDFTWYRDPKKFATQEAFEQYLRVMNTSQQPHSMTVPICTATERWVMGFQKPAYEKTVRFTLKIGGKFWEAEFNEQDKYHPFINEIIFPGTTLLYQVAINDGFEAELEGDQFVRWFYESAKKKKTDRMEGQLIHWTNPEEACYDLKNANIYKP